MAEPASNRRRDAERTKGAILAAAIAEFSSKGSAGTRVDEIAARARVNKSLIYQYFGSKQELYAEALNSVFRAASDRARALAEASLADTTPREMREYVERLLGQILTLHDDIPEYPRLLAWENLDGGKTLARPQVKRNFIQLQQSTALLLRSFEQRGLMTAKVDPRLGALGTMALVHYYTIYRALLTEMLGADHPTEQAVRRAWISHCADMLSAKAVKSEG